MAKQKTGFTKTFRRRSNSLCYNSKCSGAWRRKRRGSLITILNWSEELEKVRRADGRCGGPSYEVICRPGLNAGALCYCSPRWGSTGSSRRVSEPSQTHSRLSFSYNCLKQTHTSVHGPIAASDRKFSKILGTRNKTRTKGERQTHKSTNFQLRFWWKNTKTNISLNIPKGAPQQKWSVCTYKMSGGR